MRQKPQRFDRIARSYVESPKAVEDFLDEYEALCRKHELCISHEDAWHGAFIVERLRNITVERVVIGAKLGMLKGAQRQGRVDGKED